MPNQHGFTPDSAVQGRLEDIWRTTCGTWQNCNVNTLQAFLSKCWQHSIDPQYCMSWVEQHSDEIPGWPAVSDTAREWVNEHTSTGSPAVLPDHL